jgi:DNA repair exonuclease SbcCD nuclease subunit
MNKIQEKNIEIKRELEEPPGFKFQELSHQDKYIKFAGVSEIIPIVVEEIKNQDIKNDQQEIEESNKEATIQEEKQNKNQENQEPTKIEIEILPKLKEKYIKNKIMIKNKKYQDKSCLTDEAKIKNKFKFINYFKKKGKIFMVNQQECVGK